jgi:hypothetical protein
MARRASEENWMLRPSSMIAGWVYLVHAPVVNRVKVGVTRHPPRQRFKSLQSGNACELEMIATARCEEEAVLREREVHRRFLPNRVHGEWFDVTESSPLELYIDAVEACGERKEQHHAEER